MSEENGQISLVERARIVRNLTEAGLARAIQALLDPAGGRRGAFGWRSATQGRSIEGRSPRLRELGRLVGRPVTPPRARRRRSRPRRRPLAPVAPAAAPATAGRGGRLLAPIDPPRTAAAAPPAADDDVVVAGGRPGAAVRRILEADRP